jgi:hypothetical protein
LSLAGCTIERTTGRHIEITLDDRPVPVRAPLGAAEDTPEAGPAGHQGGA